MRALPKLAAWYSRKLSTPIAPPIASKIFIVSGSGG
jgi:hypothetical protein